MMIRAFAAVATILLCACEKKPEAVRIQLPAEGKPKISITSTPSPSISPAVRHAVPRPTPTLPPEVVLKSIIESPTIQEKRWREAKIKPAWKISVDKAVMLYERTKDRYETVEKLRSDGVPAAVIFTLHYRESSNSFKAHLHEGSSLQHTTRYIPKGRIPPPARAPFSWEDSAEDAIYVCDKLQGPWTNLNWSLRKIIAYNGNGYDARGLPSPYAWSGTSQYGPPDAPAGKFTSDGHFSSQAIDQQLGVCAILLRMKERGIDIKFAP